MMERRGLLLLPWGVKGEAMGRIGGGELLLILLIALLIFGPSKLADMGKGLGEGLKNFKKGIGSEDESKNPPTPAPSPPPQAQATPPAPPPDANKGNSPPPTT
jgi:sec-independent protein translocase protein TatA